MFLTCPACKTKYTLDETLLGKDGRTVRCTSCLHTWHQKNAPQEEGASSETASPPPPPPMAEESFADILKQTPEETPVEDNFPGQSLSPDISSAIHHNPFGVGAAQFGMLSFLLLISMTVAFISLGKDIVLHYLPAASPLYQTLGFDTMAPGEGLRFNELAAENRIHQGKKILAIEAKVTNITEKDIAYPPIKVVLKDGKKDIKEWTLRAKAPPLKSGETASIQFELKDAPNGGKTVEVSVAAD